MKPRVAVVVLAVLCVVLVWRSRAQSTEQQGQPSVFVPTYGQVASEQDIQLLRQDLRSQKQKLIAENLPMTESEAVKFWAVYNKYSEELKQINDEKFRLAREYGQDWATMTNDQALIYIRRWLEVDAVAHELRLKYVPVVSQVLPGKKAATFFQLDRRISMMIDLQLASQLPLAHTKEQP